MLASLAVGFLFGVSELWHFFMAGLDELWSPFSITKEEERGADVPRQKAVAIHRLAGRFFTKRVLSVDAVARTFKPLWKLIGELKL